MGKERKRWVGFVIELDRGYGITEERRVVLCSKGSEFEDHLGVSIFLERREEGPGKRFRMRL